MHIALLLLLITKSPQRVRVCNVSLFHVSTYYIYIYLFIYFYIDLYVYNHIDVFFGFCLGVYILRNSRQPVKPIDRFLEDDRLI